MEELYIFTGFCVITLLLLMVIVGSLSLSVRLIHKIRKIDFFWLLYMSCSYRNRKCKHDMLKDLIDTCNAHAGYFHNNSQDKGTAKSIIKYINDKCKDHIK